MIAEKDPLWSSNDS